MPGRDFALVQATLLGIEVPGDSTTAEICNAIAEHYQAKARRLAVLERQARRDLSRLQLALRFVRRARPVPVCSWPRPHARTSRSRRVTCRARSRSPGRRSSRSSPDEPDAVAEVQRAFAAVRSEQRRHGVRAGLLLAARSGVL